MKTHSLTLAGKKAFLFYIITLFAVSAMFLDQVRAQTEAQPELDQDLIGLIEPVADSVVISKKPVIRIFISGQIAFDQMLVILDGGDITPVMEQNGDEWVYHPIQILSAGSHLLEVVLNLKDGSEQRRDFMFTTRHSKKFEEAYSNNEYDMTYKTLIDKCEDLTDVNHYVFDANLYTMSRLKEGGFDTTVTANFRHLRQYLPVQPPDEEHFSLRDYLWETNYAKEELGFHSSIGDIQIDESPNTAEGIARRGGKATLEYSNYYANTFSVKSEELYGFNGGTGIGTNTDEHIVGGSIGSRFFSDSLEFKLIHVTGGEEDISYGFWAEETMKKGDVTGGLVRYSAFEEKLKMEVEYDAATYDENTQDMVPEVLDHAFRAKAEGYVNQYTWAMGYEYFGKDYQVIGNPFLYRDKEGVHLEAGAGFEISSLSLTYAQYNDNVEKDPLNVRITTKEFGFDYSYTQFQDLLVNLNYQRVVEKSSMEPDPFSVLRNYTNTYTGLINYVMGNWNLGVQTSHSFQNDRTVNDFDTTTRSYGVTPSYSSERFILSPSFNYDTVRDHTAHVSTDSYTASFNMTAHIWLKKLIWDLSGSYNKTTTSDQLSDNRIFSGTYKLSYMFDSFAGFKDTSLSLEGTYQLTRDKKTEQREHDHTVYLVLSTTLPFSF